MSGVETRWGYDIWNEYEGALKHIHANIELVELIQKFNQERILIEQSYAQKIKKLVRKYSLKEPTYSSEKAVLAYLTEASNVGAQHERLAANLEASVVKEAAYVSGEWRKTHKGHQLEGIRLDKMLKAKAQAFDNTFKKYKDAHQESLRSQEAFMKADEDRKLSRAEVDKAKHQAQTKRQEFDRLKAEYAAQRQDFNAFQRDHFQQQLPSAFKELEAMDSSILAKLNGFLYKAGVSESTVANDLMKNYEAISKCAEIVDWSADADLLVTSLKTDAVPPGDRPFVDLDQESPCSSVDNVSTGAGAAAPSPSGRSPGSSLASRSSTKKDRPVKFLRGLFNGSVSGASGGPPGAGAGAGPPARQKVFGASKRRRTPAGGKGSQDADESLTSPRPDRKQIEHQVDDLETQIRRAEKQKAALEKLIQMQEQNQKTCNMDRVQAEMAQIRIHLADLRERLARGEQELARCSRKVTKSRSLPTLNEGRRRARFSLRRRSKKTADEVNGEPPSVPGATSTPRRSAHYGDGTDDDDDYEFGPREILHQQQPHHDNSATSKLQGQPHQALALSGATEEESSTDQGNGYVTPRVHQPAPQFYPSAPEQFADPSASPPRQPHPEHPEHQQQPLATSADPQSPHYPYIGAAVALYEFEDPDDDPAILSMRREDQFYVFHRDDDWTYVTRVDGSGKGMVPTAYLSLHMY